MNKVIMLSLCLAIGGVFAEPVQLGTKSEVAAARDVVKELIKSGTGVAELLSMAEKSENGSERYWLYMSAFGLQARAGKYAEATETFKAFRANVLGLTDEDIAGIIERYAKTGLAKAPELSEILKDAKSRLAMQRLLPQLRLKVRRDPDNEELKVALGEAQAASGDWKSALKTFSETKGLAKGAAKAELEQQVTMKTAATWWSYRPSHSSIPIKVFQAHATELYTALLKDGELSDLEKTLAEKRIAQYSEEKSASVAKVGSGAEVENDAENAESKRPKEEPNDELSKLKKICNPKGLIHCWRFNGQLKDEMGGPDAAFFGKASVDEKQASLFGGSSRNNISLGESLVPNDGSPVTIELWATQKEVRSWSRVFSFGSCHFERCIFITWSHDVDAERCEIRAGRDSNYYGRGIAPFELGKEYHIAMVLESNDNGGIKSSYGKWRLHAYKQDAETGKTLKKITIPLDKGFSLRGFLMSHFHLGYAQGQGEIPAPSASYNEVRIWKRALGEQELTQNAIRFHQAGETVKAK